MSSTRIRTCTTCGSAFEVPRQPGRPAEKCSDRCRQIAAREHQRNYLMRLVTRELEGLLQAA
jgi:predicted nucleic acid-binding Zn ribbon protein